MTFASPVPMWAAVLLMAALIGMGFLSYRRTIVPLSPGQRTALGGLRGLALAATLFFLLRPVALGPPAELRDVVVPVLVDVSRSMRVADAGGQSRLERARAVLERDLMPRLAEHFTPELYAVGDGVARADTGRLSAGGGRSDLAGAVELVRQRYRGRRIAGIVLVSDGGDTQAGATGPEQAGPSLPVFTVGIGSPEGFRDGEILGITAGDPRLDEASVDLHVSAVGRGYGRSPLEVRLLANGRVLDSRSVTPAADGSPFDVVFTAAPDTTAPTRYTAEIAGSPDELVTENDTRSVLLNPAGRKRRVLALQGAPGYEHSFMTRALAVDPMLDVDIVVRKGRDEAGDETFFIQAAAGRSARLTSGFPTSREALYAYDAVIVANVEGDFFTKRQLTEVAEFVSERGGGLLVLGGRSFAPRGLIGTPLDDVLPVELNDRRGGLAPALFDTTPRQHNMVALTPSGETHPVMRMGGTVDDTREIWRKLPALAAIAPLGGPKPGATLLAVAVAPGGAIHPVVAVQRYGRGRSMVFAGEASWRWRMMQESGSRTYEMFWRQAARWLAGPAPDPVSVSIPEGIEPGDEAAIGIEARDAEFAPVADALVDVTLTEPGGTPRTLTVRRDPAAPGRFAATLPSSTPGLYRVRVDARRGTTSLGSAERWFLVGGSDREFTDPRLNEGFLRRLARNSGGLYVTADEAASIVPPLRDIVPQDAVPERRDLWNEPWAFALVVLLLSAEWVLRRRWGLQ